MSRNTLKNTRQVTGAKLPKTADIANVPLSRKLSPGYQKDLAIEYERMIAENEIKKSKSRKHAIYWSIGWVLSHVVKAALVTLAIPFVQWWGLLFTLPFIFKATMKWMDYFDQKRNIRNRTADLKRIEDGI